MEFDIEDIFNPFYFRYTSVLLYAIELPLLQTQLCVFPASGEFQTSHPEFCFRHQQLTIRRNIELHCASNRFQTELLIVENA